MGYNTSANRGADTFSPFSKGNFKNVDYMTMTWTNEYIQLIFFGTNKASKLTFSAKFRRLNQSYYSDRNGTHYTISDGTYIDKTVDLGIGDNSPYLVLVCYSDTAPVYKMSFDAY